VGLKTAQRIILELKDKLAKNVFSSPAAGQSYAAAASGGSLSEVSEAVNALTVLGYSRQQALDAVKGLDTRSKSVETIIREALKALNTK
ncbi:MAG: Holliday junction branch migration protein RuvA, partial [Clostridia bacterium]|nr:Holliday junction branch migration protein RuvA [Clostridia bacterium]